MLIADTQTTVTITNSSLGPIRVVGIDAAQELSLLADMAAGEVRDVVVPSGIGTIAFAQNDAWLGKGFQVTGEPGLAVTVPLLDDGQDGAGAKDDALKAMQQRQSGEGSVELAFSNATADAASVVVVDEANDGYPLFDVPAGETVVQRVLPNAKLWFYKTGTADAISGPYLVAGTEGEIVTIAAADDTRSPELKAMQAYQAGAGSVEVTFTSTVAGAVTVVSVDENNNGYPLYAVAAGESVVQRAQPGSKLWFYDFATKEVVSGPYTVTLAEGQEATIAPPDPATGPVASEMQIRQSGEGSVEVTFSNETADTALVVVTDDADVGHPLFDVEPGRTVLQRALPAARLWFYKKGTDEVINGPYVVAGTDGGTATITVKEAAPEAPELTAMQKLHQGPGSVELAFSNALDEAVIVAAVNDQNKPGLLFEIDAGQSVTQRALPSATLLFYRKDTRELVGSPYLVGGAVGQAVAIPYDPSVVARAEQSGPGSIEIDLVNRRNHGVTVAIAGADGLRTDLYDVPALAPGHRVKVLPGTRLWFFETGTKQQEGDELTVGTDTARVAIPHIGSIASGSAPFTTRFVNKSGFNVTAYTPDAQNRRVPLFDMPAGGESSLQLPAQTTVWFFKAGTDEEIPEGYLAPDGDPGTVPVPYARLSAEARKQAGEGSIPVTFVNNSSDSAAVTTLNDARERVTLFNIPANQTATHRLQPSAAIWFYRGDTQDFLTSSLPYFVRGSNGESVSLPYNPSDGEILALTNISIDKLVSNFVDRQQVAALSRSGPQQCWKDSYGRGVGTIPRNCLPGQEESTPGLCYDKCQAGYSSAVTMCVPSCPAGFRDDGLYCFKPAPYSKTAFPWKAFDSWNMNDALKRCRASAEGRKYGCGVFNSNTMVYTGCPSGYETAPALNFLCSPKCPSNTIDIGISCMKKTYDRGVGKLMSCAPGKHWDAGLCYDQCSSGYAGVGPVCWNSCPTDIPYQCGAMCTKDKSVCDSALTDQVLGPVFAVGSIALTVATAGGSTGATAAAKAGATAAKTAAQIAAKAAAKSAARTTLKNSVRSALNAAAKNGLKGAKMVAIDTAIGAGLGVVLFGGQSIAAEVGRNQMREKLREIIPKQIVGEVSDTTIQSVVDQMMAGVEKNDPGVDFPWTALDPTGIADIVIAYNHPKCSDLPRQ